MSERLARKLATNPSPAVVEAIRIAAVLCADSGLSPSALAARVAGSYGAGIGGIVSAGLAVHSARFHGAASNLIAAKLALIVTARPRASSLAEITRTAQNWQVWACPSFLKAIRATAPSLKRSDWQLRSHRI